MTRNSIFDLENWGSTYTQEVDLYTSKYGSLHLSKFSSSVYKSAKPIMSDILVYVNKRSFCCVIAENTDATLELFRHKMDAQDDDLLCSPFKFTRLVKGKRVTVGVKQEAFIKLKQCMEESHEATIYLIWEETKTQESANHVESTTSQGADREKRMSSHCQLKKPRTRNNPL